MTVGAVPSDKKLEEMRDHLYGNLHIESMSVMILDLLKRVRDEASSAYRCYSCKQVFEEDHGHGLAFEHFGSHLAGDVPKCTGILNGTATWGGGPHDPFYRVRKDHYEMMEKEIIELKAECFKLSAGVCEHRGGNEHGNALCLKTNELI